MCIVTCVLYVLKLTEIRTRGGWLLEKLVHWRVIPTEGLIVVLAYFSWCRVRSLAAV